MDTIRFARAGSSKVLGFLVYLLVSLCLGAFVGIMGAALAAWGAEAARFPDGVQIAAAVAGGAGPFVLVTWFAWRDFRRRAGAEVVVAPDRVVLNGAELLFAEIDAVRLRFDGWAPTIELEGSDGRRRRVPPDLAPFQEIEPLLLERLLPRMLERFEAELAAGRAVPLRESGARAVGRIAYGVFLLLVAPLMIVSIRLAAKGFDAFRLGAARIRQGWRGRGGGFTLTADGVLPPGEEARALPWRELTAESLDAHGVTLVSLEGPRVSASLFATNFWPLSRLIAARLK